jgi:hypothetical protein
MHFFGAKIMARLFSNRGALMLSIQCSVDPLHCYRRCIRNPQKRRLRPHYPFPIKQYELSTRVVILWRNIANHTDLLPYNDEDPSGKHLLGGDYLSRGRLRAHY